MACKVVRQVAVHRCDGPHVGVLVTSIRVGSLASRAGLAVQRWGEPGLGGQQGFNAELSIGAVVHAEECLERLDLGTAFYADLNDIRRVSLAAFIEACCQGFGLSADDVAWRQCDETLAAL